MTIATDWVLAAGEYVEVMVAQVSGGALDVDFAANFTPVFSMTRIGPAT
jgi:hypothetical protein